VPTQFSSFRRYRVKDSGPLDLEPGRPLRDGATGIGKWTDEQIVTSLCDGKRPDGAIAGPPMPVPVYRQLPDHDATAIAAYLRSLKPVQNEVARSQYAAAVEDT
jgi:hypothetical protein